ncbi:MAG TPA: hypothetical protein VGH72_01210, partial [Pseudonocardia sp.]
MPATAGEASTESTENSAGLPYRYPTDSCAARLLAEHGELPPGRETDTEVRLAGRLRSIRRQGHLSFAVLGDSTGQLQLFVDTDTIGDGAHRAFDA